MNLWISFNRSFDGENYKINIKKLHEGVYLATSKDIQGLVAQGRTIEETIEIARDVAKKLIEAQEEKLLHLPSIKKSFDYPLVIGS